jgi:hypothetical protein
MKEGHTLQLVIESPIVYVFPLSMLEVTKAVKAKDVIIKVRHHKSGIFCRKRNNRSLRRHKPCQQCQDFGSYMYDIDVV